MPALKDTNRLQIKSRPTLRSFTLTNIGYMLNQLSRMQQSRIQTPHNALPIS
jgi:hypothetical protein